MGSLRAIREVKPDLVLVDVCPEGQRRDRSSLKELKGATPRAAGAGGQHSTIRSTRSGPITGWGGPSVMS